MLNRCKNLDYGSIHRFCKAVREDIENSKEKHPLAQYQALLSSLCYLKMSLKLLTYIIHSMIVLTHRTLGQMPSL
jgi:hypothetical protein